MRASAAAKHCLARHMPASPTTVPRVGGDGAAGRQAAWMRPARGAEPVKAVLRTWMEALRSIGLLVEAKLCVDLLGFGPE